MRVTVIAISVSALTTIPKGLEIKQEELDLRGKIETIRTTALLRSTKILVPIPKTRRDDPPLRF